MVLTPITGQQWMAKNDQKGPRNDWVGDASRLEAGLKLGPEEPYGQPMATTG